MPGDTTVGYPKMSLKLLSDSPHVKLCLGQENENVNTKITGWNKAVGDSDSEWI